MADQTIFQDAVKRMDEIAKELANGTSKSKGKKIIELRKLCSRHLTVPNAYQLEGVVKVEPLPRRNSMVSELWKGRYKGEEVALKAFKVPRGAAMSISQRLYKEMVLMKQVDHENILPFYGMAASTPFDFCLVFPWYENGGIMDYLKGNPDIDRYWLLLGAVSGLGFLHGARLVHGALQPSRVLIDDDGNARLTFGGNSSIVAEPNASTSGLVHSASTVGDCGDDRYSAPEIGWPEEYGMNNVTITKESDVYGMAMVIYEVLTGNKPYHGYSYREIIPNKLAGEIPERPDRIHDLVWELLKECWSRDPAERPTTIKLRNTLSNLDPAGRPKTTEPRNTPPDLVSRRGWSTAGELPGELRVLVQNIKFLVDERKKRQFTVELAYGDRIHVTAPTRPVDDSRGHTWIDPESWVITINQQHYKHLVSLKLIQKGGLFRKNKHLAEGSFSLLGNVNKQILVKLKAADGTGSALLKVFLMEM